MLNDEILEEYINGFYGYGNLEAPFWFVGMEEGGGNTFDEINRRAKVWKSRGSHEVEDLFEFHKDIEITEFFGPKARLQRTWGKLIRIIFEIRGIEPEKRRLLDYQINRLGRKNDETYLSELLPLPSPDATKWNYEGISEIDYLKNRDTYLQKLMPLRIASLRKKVELYRPKLLVCYGKKYESERRNISGLTSFAGESPFQYGKRNETLIVFINHPLYSSNDFLQQIGRVARHELSFRF